MLLQKDLEFKQKQILKKKVKKKQWCERLINKWRQLLFMSRNLSQLQKKKEKNCKVGKVSMKE